MTSPTPNPASPDRPGEQPGDQAGAPTDAATRQTDEEAGAIEAESGLARTDDQAAEPPRNVVAIPLAGTSATPPAVRPVAAPVGAADVPVSRDPAADATPLRDRIEKLMPIVPGLMIVLGLIAMFLAGMPARSGAADQAYREFFASFAVIAPILLMLGFYLQARQILADPFSRIDRTLNEVNSFRSDELERKLESLDAGLSYCRYAASSSRPIKLLALALLAYGAVFTVLSMFNLTISMSPTGPQMDLVVGAPPAGHSVAQPNLLMEILLSGAPPIALIIGLILIVWYAYQASRLKEFSRYIIDERAVVIGKKRILDRYASRYVELASLTEQVSEMIKVNEKLAASDARKNSALLLLGVILSALISIVGILGAADLLTIGGRSLNGNVVSAILGVVVAAIITTQNTFRLAERSRFQRQVASDGRKLFTELVFSVDNNQKFQAVLKEYQHLSDRSARDFPTARELEAPAESGQSQRESSAQDS